MLRINVFKGTGGVLNYYNQTLKSGDYYVSQDGINQSQEIIGDWQGNLAKELGLSGQITQQDFYKLTNNINPKTGQELTARTVAGRRVGYDFNFHVPKSFSVIQALNNDSRLTDIFRDSVKEAMTEMESQMLTRVRKNRAMEDRQTSNMAWAEFIHFTARPVGGVPDPHLHAHCFTFNATFDEIENQFKAGQFVDIKRNADLSQAKFHATLMAKTKALGYDIRLKPKGWEIDGVPQSVIDRFSRRTEQVEKQAKELGIIDDKIKEKLGSTTREKKQKEIGLGELKGVWNMQLTSQEKKALEKVKIQAQKSYSKKGKELDNQTKQEDKALILQEAVNLALDDILERKSVASFKDITKKALLYSKGQVDIEDIKKELSKREADKALLSVDLHKQGKFYTTQQVLSEEQKLVEFINSGRGKYAKMKLDETELNQDFYSNEQKDAVKMLFNSTDAVTSIRGGAGTGKTTLLQLATEKLKQAGKETLIFAPSSGASRGVLRADGFDEADTVAKYLQSQKLQNKAKDQVVWIDEAGLLSVPQLKKVLETARIYKSRVVLSGDSRQHNSVEKGDALRILEEKSGLEQAELKETKRQKNEEYKQAVENIRDGKAGLGFENLEKMGAIIEEQNPNKRTEQIAKDYADLTAQRESVLVVSPTHSEGLAITQKIRQELKNRQLLGLKQKPFEVLNNKNLTEVERQSQFLEEGNILQFFKEFEGIKRSINYEVKTEKDKDGFVNKFVVDSNGKKIKLDKNWAKDYNVYSKNKLELSLNDKIRITQNGKDRNNQELLNGQDLTITGFDYNGRIVAKDQQGTQYNLPKNFQNFNYGYVATSHSSQGKTSDYVLVGQSSSSFSASDQKQFYVSVSRGRKGVKVYTDNKQELKQAIMPTKNRMSALDLLKARLEKAKMEDRKQEQLRKEKITFEEKPNQEKPKTNHPFLAKKQEANQNLERPRINPFVVKRQEENKDLENNLQPNNSPPNPSQAQNPTKKWSDITPTQTQQDYQQSQQKTKERTLYKD